MPFSSRLHVRSTHILYDPHASLPFEEPAQHWRLGDAVVIQNLSRRKELNGLVGTVVKERERPARCRGRKAIRSAIGRACGGNRFRGSQIGSLRGDPGKEKHKQEHAP